MSPMRFIVFVSIMLATPLVADLDEYCRQLMSDDFKVRQKAEEDLSAWAQEKEKEERAEALFQRYVASQDPEEFHRLTKVLLAVHFDLKKSSIPQQGPGFIGISMAGTRRFGQNGIEVIDEPRDGAVIEAVIADTPAQKAGLMVGDRITEIGGQSIAGDSPSGKLKEMVGGQAPGTTIHLTVVRGEEILALKVTLMNKRAVPELRNFQGESRVDFKKAEELLREDYLRWLAEQRKAERLQER